jgi:hypothetical protein
LTFIQVWLRAFGLDNSDANFHLQHAIGPWGLGPVDGDRHRVLRRELGIEEAEAAAGQRQGPEVAEVDLSFLIGDGDVEVPGFDNAIAVLHAPIAVLVGLRLGGASDVVEDRRALGAFRRPFDEQDVFEHRQAYEELAVGRGFAFEGEHARFGAVDPGDRLRAIDRQEGDHLQESLAFDLAELPERLQHSDSVRCIGSHSRVPFRWRLVRKGPGVRGVADLSRLAGFGIGSRAAASRRSIEATTILGARSTSSASSSPATTMFMIW